MINVMGVMEVDTHNSQLPKASQKMMEMLWMLEKRINQHMHTEVVRWSGVSYSTVRAIATGTYNVNVKTIIALDVALDKMEWIVANGCNTKKITEDEYVAMRLRHESGLASSEGESDDQ